MVGRTRLLRAPSTRSIVAACVALLVVLGAGFAWIAFRGYQAMRELQVLAPLASEVSEALSSRDLPRLRALTEEIDARSGRAAAAMADPVWGVAEAMPVVGPDLSTARVVSEQLHSIVGRAVEPLLGVVDGVATRPLLTGGVVDLDAIASAREPLAEAHESLEAARDALASTRTSGLLPSLREASASLRDAVATGADVTDGLSKAVEVLPAMLGSEGSRSILVMFQNNAELRTGGGITGSFALLTADRGSITLSTQTDSSAFPARSDPIIPIPESTSAMYGDVVGRFVQNISAPADFDLSARLASAWWQEYAGTRPDAVISIDPIAIRALLGAAGPVTLPDGGELSADNLVQRLLIDPYMLLDTDGQTAFMQQATSATFEHLLSGTTDPIAWAMALAPAIEQGRVSVWSAHEAEQRVLAPTPLGGPLARHRAAGEDAFAVYFNDGTGGKMDSFLDVRIESGVASCRPDGRHETSILLTVSSRAPANAADALPWSMTGGGIQGAAVGDIGTSVTVAAPPGSFFGGVLKNGLPAVTTDVDDNGFPSSTMRVNLSPGEVNTVEFRFIAPDAREIVPQILHTPMIDDPVIGTMIAGCR